MGGSGASAEQKEQLSKMASTMAMMTPERLAELTATATALCAPGKGFLASDESAGPWLRAGHAEAAKIPDVIENRAAYRSLCFRNVEAAQKALKARAYANRDAVLGKYVKGTC